MKALLQKLNINETFTKPIQKQRVFNSVTLNVPKIADYNYMADLLELPYPDIQKMVIIIYCVLLI
jgi:hypothetical protein